MHIHILGICGTFMGGIALLARELGYRVTGSDANVYPPMSTQLRAAGIDLMEGYLPEHLHERPDCVVVGNAMTRGNPVIEYMLNQGLPYTSGPQWLAENLLRDKWVLAVSGTHGKTTTSSLLAWILEYAGMAPGFLIGGVPGNFGLSARTDMAGVAEFISLVDRWGYTVRVVDTPPDVLHFKTDCSLLDADTILSTKKLDASGCFAGYKVIHTVEGEEACANTIRFNNLVVMPAGFPRTRDKLISAGYDVREVGNSEAAKLDGGMSCLSLRFSPSA